MSRCQGPVLSTPPIDLRVGHRRDKGAGTMYYTRSGYSDLAEKVYRAVPWIVHAQAALPPKSQRSVLYTRTCWLTAPRAPVAYVVYQCPPSPPPPPPRPPICFNVAVNTALDQVQCCFTSTQTVRTAQDGHLHFHTAPELCECIKRKQCLKVS